MIGPVIEELATEYESTVKIGKLNVDNNGSVAANYGIRSIPSLLIFKNGEVVDTIIGAVPKNELQRRLDGVVA